MIITCGQCLAKFKVAPEQIKEAGSKVRCSNCQHVFTVYRPGFEPEDREIGRQSLHCPPQEPRSGGAAKSSGQPAYGPDDGDSFDNEDYYEDDDQSGDPEDNFYSDDYSAQGHYPSPESDSESLSLKERRDRRRRLYADLGDEADQEAEEEYYYEDETEDDDDGRPPLRRSSARAAQARAEYEDDDEPGRDEYEDEGDEYYEDDGEYKEELYEEYEEYEEESEEEYDDEYELAARKRRRASLGLSADPMESVSGYIDDADFRGQGGNPDDMSVRAAITKVSGQRSLPIFIVLGILILILVIGFLFFSGRPAPTALSTGEQLEGSAGALPGQGDLIETDNEDRAGTKFLTFTRNSQNHFWRQNRDAGQILIITGMVRNSYPEARSFIRLRGHLLGSDNTSLADRFFYAGNIISIDELQTLPADEILARLSIKGGTDGKNMNVPPGAEIPFMVVFDKLPDGMTEYRIDPVGSSPAQGQ